MAAIAIPLIGSAISGLAGLFGGQQQPTQKVSGTTSSTITPNLSPIQISLMNMFTNGLQSRYQQGTDLSGYTAQGLRTINQQGNLQDQATKNILAARGQSFSPAATTADIQNSNSRLAQSSSFLNSIPLLQRQLQGEDLNNLISGFKALPTGQTTQGTLNQTSTQTVPGGGIAGLLSGLGAGLFSPTGSGGSSGISSILGGLFGGGNKVQPTAPNNSSTPFYG